MGQIDNNEAWADQLHNDETVKSAYRAAVEATLMATGDERASPSLVERVVNDKTVKAARRAYEAAYIKAYAEAREPI